jgi:hypothetical protein
MSNLFPRLLPSETERLFEDLHRRSLDELTQLAKTTSDRAVFGATGGRRVTSDELEALRFEVMDAARSAGYPAHGNLLQRNEFDQRVAKYLHASSGMLPGEASQRQVWSFMALVLMPDACAWRFPMNVQQRYQPDRFKGSDLTRHALARLWTRAHVLRDPSTGGDPYHLLAVLGESDLDQIMARRDSVAATPALVRAVVRGHRDDSDGAGPPARRVLRDSLMRLLRLTAFLDLDGFCDSDLDALVLTQRKESRQHLTS